MLVSLNPRMSPIFATMPNYMTGQRIGHGATPWFVAAPLFFIQRNVGLHYPYILPHTSLENVAGFSQFSRVSIRLRLKGMGYYFAHRPHVLFIISGKSHALCFYLPNTLHSRIIGKRSRILILSSSQAMGLQTFITLLARYVSCDVYRLKGLFPLGASFLKRQGKKKFM